MRWTQTLIPTQKETPADAQVVSHQLMVRAGLIRQLTAGAYDFLPLGYRSLRKAAQIVREEMDAIGCAEVFLPALQPIELWQRSGRDVAYGDNLMKFKDRHGRINVLGPATFDAAPTGELEKIHTPGMPGIEDVGKFMKVKPKNMLKTLVFKATGANDVDWVVAVVRGDHDVNEAKLKKAATEKFGVK